MPAVQTEPVLQQLTTAECLAHLRTKEFGRLAVIVDGAPDVYPVNYVMDGDAVVIRTEPGSGVDGSILQRVAFEADEIDDESHEGWSVVVRGVVREVTDAVDAPSKRARSLPLTPWAPGRKGEWIKILDTTIVGRRLVRRTV